MSIKKELFEEIGLTKAETNVYLALLELGSSTTGPIVEKSHVSSSKIYEILEKLMQKGLASFVIKNGMKYFEASNPQRLLDYLKEKETELKTQENKLQQMLPELELKRKLSEDKTEATIYKGMKGLDTAFQDIINTLSTGNTVYNFVVGNIDERMNNFFLRQYQLRAKNGIKTKTIFSESARSIYQTRKNLPLSEGKIIGTTSSPATVTVYGDKVNLRMGNSENVISLAINNKDLANSFLEQFNNLWNQDVNVYKGFEAVTNKFNSMLDLMKENEEYQVLGASHGEGGKKLKEWFMQYHQDRIKRKIKVKILAVSNDYSEILPQLTQPPDQEMKLVKIKQLPPEFTSPMQINLYPNDKVLMFLWGKELICFEIDSKILHQNFSAYFEGLWQQETKVMHGVEAVKIIFEEMLNYNSVDWIAARGYFVDLCSKEYIDNWEKRAIQKGFKIRNIVDPEIRGNRITTFPFAQTKYTLPQEFSKLSVFWIYGNKVVISNWVEKEPIVIIIENKNLYDTYKQQFEVLWNQKITALEGEIGVKALFEDMLNYSDVYFIGGNGGIKKYFPKYWQEHNKKRIKQKVMWHDLIDAKLMSNLFPKQERAKVPYYEYKILPPELSSPHVIVFYGNKIANIIWREKTLVTIIEDKEVIEGYQKYFNYLWKTIE